MNTGAQLFYRLTVLKSNFDTRNGNIELTKEQVEYLLNLLKENGGKKATRTCAFTKEDLEYMQKACYVYAILMREVANDEYHNTVQPTHQRINDKLNDYIYLRTGE